MYGCSYVFIYQSDFAYFATPAAAPPTGAGVLPDVLEAFVPPLVIDELPVPAVALPSTFVTFPGDILDPPAFVPWTLIEEAPPPFVALPSAFVTFPGNVLDPPTFVPPAMIEELSGWTFTPAAVVAGASFELPVLEFVPPVVIEEPPPPFAALPSTFVTFPGNILDPPAFVPFPLIEEPPPPFAALPPTFVTFPGNVLDPPAFVPWAAIEEPPPPLASLPATFVTFVGNILDPLAFVPWSLIEEAPPPFAALPATFVTFDGNVLDPLDFICPAIIEEVAGWSFQAVAVVAWAAIDPAVLDFFPPDVIDDPIFAGYDAFIPASVPAVQQSPLLDDELGYVFPCIPNDIPLDSVRSPIGIWTSYGRPFLYTEDNWFGTFFVFETYMRASTGTIYARVFNETDAEPVVGSQLSTIETAHIRQRTPGIFLLDGKEYRSQFAESEPVGTGKRIAAHLIAIRGVATPIPNSIILGAVKDTVLESANPLDDINAGGEGSMRVGNNSGVLNSNRALLHYSLPADIPPGATIVECHLVLHEFGLSNSVAAKVHRLTQPNWVELICTWNIYDTGLPWTLPGGDYTETDPVDVNWVLGPNGFTSLPGLAGLAQDALNNRGRQLHMLLKITTEGAGVKFVSFHSKDFTSDPTLQPKLHVSWI